MIYKNDKHEAFSEYSDMHKTVHGFRPRFNWEKCTLADLEKMMTDLCAYANWEFKEQEIQEKKSWTTFRAKLKQLANDSDVSMTTVLYWIFSEYENDGYGFQLRSICADYRISSQKQSVLYRMLRKGGHVQASDFPQGLFKT